MAKKFFFVCAGMLLLALSYHFGFSTASAQSSSQFVSLAIASNGGSTYTWGALTSNGDVYSSNGGGFFLMAHISPGGPIPTNQESWGQLKARYR